MVKKPKTQTQNGAVAQATPDRPATRPAPNGPHFAVCRVKETTVVSTKHEYGRRFGEGTVVDLAEKIADDVYLGDLVREGCFERVSVAEAARLADESERTKSEPAETDDPDEPSEPSKDEEN